MHPQINVTRNPTYLNQAEIYRLIPAKVLNALLEAFVSWKNCVRRSE